MNIALINDTSMKKHIGCQLVGQAYDEQCRINGINIRLRLPYWESDYSTYFREFETLDLLIINGEGSTHHGKKNELLQLANYFPSVLINCVYQDNPKNSCLAKFLYISARESLSLNELRLHGAHAELVPDVALIANQLVNFQAKRGNMDIGVSDNVVAPWCGFPISHDHLDPYKYMTNMCLYRRLCIGRFHAVIIAASLGIPFATWPSNSWKIAGIMRDMSLEKYHHPTLEKAYHNVPSQLPSTVHDYVHWGRKRIVAMFAKISQL